MNLSRAGEFRDISFEVHEGEILGLAGLVGAGRTEVAQALFGITRPDSGEIRLYGKLVQIDSPAKAMQLGIAYVPEDRLSQGLVLEYPIRSNITSPIWQKMSNWFRLLDFAYERRLAQDNVSAPLTSTRKASTSKRNRSLAAISRRWCWRNG